MNPDHASSHQKSYKVKSKQILKKGTKSLKTKGCKNDEDRKSSLPKGCDTTIANGVKSKRTMLDPMRAPNIYRLFLLVV